MARRMKKNTKNYVHIMILLILFTIMIVSLIKIINWLIDNNKSKQNLNKVSYAITVDEKTGEYEVDFNELKDVNEDIVAWLKVGGLDISFPVVKTTNNSYYLDHSIDKTYNTAGWIFMDYKNKLDGTDKNIVIYGHNRRNGSMFGKLKKILEEEWYKNKENTNVHLITKDENMMYEVFSVYTVKDEDLYITTEFTSSSYQNFLNIIKSRSIYNFGIDVTTDDQIITLSTCADNMKYRIVLHAKKVP